MRLLTCKRDRRLEKAKGLYRRGEPYVVIAVVLGVSPEMARIRCQRWPAPHPGSVLRRRRERRLARLRTFWLARAA